MSTKETLFNIAAILENPKNVDDINVARLLAKDAAEDMQETEQPVELSVESIIEELEKSYMYLSNPLTGNERALVGHIVKLCRPKREISERERGGNGYKAQLAAKTIAIQKFAQREIGWDGENGMPPTTEAIDDAISFLKFLSNKKIRFPASILSPGDGEIVFQWRAGLKFAEVGFYGDTTVSWYCTDGEKKSYDDIPYNRENPCLPFAAATGAPDGINAGSSPAAPTKLTPSQIEYLAREAEKVRSAYISNKKGLGLQGYDYIDAMKEAVYVIVAATTQIEGGES